MATHPSLKRKCRDEKDENARRPHTPMLMFESDAEDDEEGHTLPPVFVSAELDRAELGRLRDELAQSNAENERLRAELAKVKQNHRASVCIAYKDLDVLHAKYDKLLKARDALTATPPRAPPRRSLKRKCKAAARRFYPM